VSEHAKTAEENVKAKYGADKYVYCSGLFDPDKSPHYITHYVIISALEPQTHLGFGKTPYEAWQDAAKRTEVSR